MTLVAFLVLLGVLITVHELGHFLVAKASGVRVLTFSIGFGPTLVSFRRGETEYRVGLLPLGGYVRMYGDDVSDEVPAAEKHRAFLEKPTPIKMAIAFAGPAANLLLPLVLFFGIAVGTEEVTLPVVGTVLPGEPAETAGLRPGDRITAVNGAPVATFSDLVDTIGPRPDLPTPVVVDRAGASVTLTVTPRAATDAAGKPVGRIGMLATRTLPTVNVAEGSSAALAGVQRDDRVVDVNGAATADLPALLAALDAADPAQPLTLTVERKAPKESKESKESKETKETKETKEKPIENATNDPNDTKATASSSSPPPKAPEARSSPVAQAKAATDQPEQVRITLTIPGVAPAPAATPAAMGDVSALIGYGLLRGLVRRADLGCSDVVEAGCAQEESPPVPTSTTAPEVPLVRFALLDDDLAAAALGEQVRKTRAAVSVAIEEQQRRRGLAGQDGQIAGVIAESPAGEKGLKAGTRVVAVDGVALRTASDLPVALAKDMDGPHVIGLVDERGQGSAFAFLMAKSTKREQGGQKILGLTLTQAQGDAQMATREVSVAEAARRAVTETGETIGAVVAGYAMLITGKVGLDQLGGPVMLATIAGEAARSGVEVFATTMALLSVNLALLNLLPVPVLDGGHLLLFSIEAVRRKRLTAEARLRATKVGLVFVGVLMFVAIFNDVRSLFG